LVLLQCLDEDKLLILENTSKMKRFQKSKRGAVFDQMNSLAVALAALVIVFAVMFLVIAQVLVQIATVEGINAANTSQQTIAYNATEALQAAAATVPPWIPLIVITVIGAILIGLVAMFGRK